MSQNVNSIRISNSQELEQEHYSMNRNIDKTKEENRFSLSGKRSPPTGFMH